MPRPPRPVALDALIVVMAAGGLWLSVLSVRSVAWLPLVLFALAASAAALTSIKLRDGAGTSLHSVVLFTAILVGGPLLAVATVPGAALALGLRAKGMPVRKVAFNFGQWSLLGALAGLVYTLLGGVPGEVGARSLLALAVAVPIYVIGTTFAVSVAIWLVSGESLRSLFSRSTQSAVVAGMLNIALSVIAAGLILEVHIAVLPLLLMPLLVAQSGLQGFESQDTAYEALVDAIVAAIELKDPYTRGHGDRVGQLAVAVAESMGYDFEQLRVTRYAARLHDVGKIGIPLSIISKKGSLTDEEFDKIKEHPEIGYEILRDIDFLAPAIEGVLYHHERMDGRGYPTGVAGDDVPEIARIITVVDAFDAMTSTRSYRHAREVDVALIELDRCAGSQFDADVVRVAREVIEGLEWTPTYAAEELAEFETARRLRLGRGDVLPSARSL